MACELQVCCHPKIHKLEVLEKPHLSLSNSSFLPLCSSFPYSKTTWHNPSSLHSIPPAPSSAGPVCPCWVCLLGLFLQSSHVPVGDERQLGPSAGCKLTLCWCELLFLDGIDNHTVISPLSTPPQMTDSCGLQYKTSLFIFSQPYMCSPCCREAE